MKNRALRKWDRNSKVKWSTETIIPSVLKSDPYQIASSPNDLAPVNIMKIIECEFKTQWQDTEVLQLNSCATFCYIMDVAGEYATLFVKEQ